MKGEYREVRARSTFIMDVIALMLAFVVVFLTGIFFGYEMGSADRAVPVILQREP